MTDRESNLAGLLVEPLTRREREILGLLNQGYSAPEIAEQLTLAVSTIKSHIQQVYGKLGVNSKRQALTRAKELGLLETSLPTTPPESPPAPKTTRHNVPLQLTRFIGREREVADVQRLLSTTRLVTLTGPGGTGKTRLALQIGVESLSDFAHGVWLAELAPIADPAQVPEAVAQALALPDQRGQSLQQVLMEHLNNKTLLLILDNCEHLVQACAELAEQLLRAAPGLRILATSREALGVAGEHSYPVPALSVPDPGKLPPLETLAQSEAVRLFVERATAVRPDFALTDENAQVVAQICQRLDGIPLALELAAARAQALSAEQIAALLDEAPGFAGGRFRLLTGGSRTAPPRQQTLRGAIDWSYALLTDGEQALLRRLSVFAGGWTLEAAGQMMSAPDVLDLLTQLVGKSLVLSEQQPGQAARFRMLETIREYAQEKLTEAGEAEAVQSQHFDFYVSLAEEAEPELKGHGQIKWLNRLDRENDNFRRALAWALKREKAESALRLAGALWVFWDIRSNHSEGHRWLGAALNLNASGSSLERSACRAKALGAAAALALVTPSLDLAAEQSRLEESLSIYRELGDRGAGMAEALVLLSMYRSLQQDFAMALQLLEESLDLWMAAEDEGGIGFCLTFTAWTFDLMGNRVKAMQFKQRSVAFWRAAGDRWSLLQVQGSIAWQFWLDSDVARAREMFEEALAASDELGSGWIMYDIWRYLYSISVAQGDYARASAMAFNIQNFPGSQRHIASGLTRLGQIGYLQGHFTDAQTHFEAALKIFRELKDDNGMGWVPPWLGCVAYRAGALDRAQSLIEEGLAIHDPDGDWSELAFALLARGDVARAQGEAATAAKYYARSLKILVEHQDQPDVAERLEGFAKLAGTAQQPQRAARLFGAAQALRDRIGTPIPPIERADYDGAMALARTQLDPAEFDAAGTEGRALSWEQAAAYALEKP